MSLQRHSPRRRTSYRYPSDLTDAQWNLIEPFVVAPAGSPRQPLRGESLVVAEVNYGRRKSSSVLAAFPASPRLDVVWSRCRCDLSISGFAVRLICDHLVSIEEEIMKYVMLIYQGTALEQQAALPEEEQKKVYADYQGINQTPGVTPGLPMGLPQNATTVRVDGGKTLTTDGPFVGMKEAVGGWFILEADDLDAAIEMAARVPAARHGGAVEIRPSEVYW